MKTGLKEQTLKSIGTLVFLVVFFAAQAQLKGGHILCAMGLQLVTQTPANTFSVYIPGYFYTASSLRDANGDKSPVEPDFTMTITGAGISSVSEFKF